MLGIEKWRFIMYALFLLAGLSLGVGQALAAEIDGRFDSSVTNDRNINAIKYYAIPFVPIEDSVIERLYLPIFKVATSSGENPRIRIMEGAVLGGTRGVEIFDVTVLNSDILDDSLLPCTLHDYSSLGCFPLVLELATTVEVDEGVRYTIEISEGDAFFNTNLRFSIDTDVVSSSTDVLQYADISTTTVEVFHGAPVFFVDGIVGTPPLIIPVQQNFHFLLSTTTCVQTSSGTVCSFDYSTTSEEIPVINNTQNLILGLFMFMTVLIFLANYFKPRRGHLV